MPDRRLLYRYSMEEPLRIHIRIFKGERRRKRFRDILWLVLFQVLFHTWGRCQHLTPHVLICALSTTSWQAP